MSEKSFNATSRATEKDTPPRRQWFGSPLYSQERVKIKTWLANYSKHKNFDAAHPDTLKFACDWIIDELAKDDDKWTYLLSELRHSWVYRYWCLMKFVSTELNLSCPLREQKPDS